MGKLQKACKAILAILRNPWLLNLVLSEDSIWKKHISQSKKSYKPLRVIELETLFGRIEDEIHALFLDGGSMVTDLLLLKKLCQKFEGCNYFEIGTWRGESVLNVADECKRCVTLNLNKDEMIQLGISEEKASQVGILSKNINHVQQVYGNSMTFDFQTVGGPFDVVFIDGDHHYDFVVSDTKNVFKHLIHKKSIVVWHDYAHSPEHIRPEVLAGIYDGCPESFHDNIYHVNNSLCAIYIPEEIKSELFINPAPVNKVFKVSLKTETFSPENLRA